MIIESKTESESLPGLSAAFTSVAGTLEKAEFGQDAYEGTIAIDPDIQAITQFMAEALGATNQTGLRGTVTRTSTKIIELHRTMRPYNLPFWRGPR